MKTKHYIKIGHHQPKQQRQIAKIKLKYRVKERKYRKETSDKP